MPEALFPESSFVKAHLLQKPLYAEQFESWEALRRHREEVRHYFRQIGQELVVDEAEGLAFLRQLEPEEDEPVPRLSRRRPLGYAATLLLVCLREDFARFDVKPGESTRLIRRRDELHALAAGFLRETNNQVKDAKALDAAIQQLAELGFLNPLPGEDRNTFEVMRLVRARVAPGELEAVRDRLQRYVQSGT